LPDEDRSLAGRLAALVNDSVSELEGIQPRSVGDVVEYRVDGTLFAALHGGVLEVELGPAIASAAFRTADTKASDRGSGWVRFAPRVLDRFGSDRARSWFEAAWRRASGISPSAG
jgi:hypothetical protein